MSVAPVPILVLSGRVGPDSQAAAAALAAGALDAVAEDARSICSTPAAPRPTAFRRRLKLLSGTRVIRHPRGAPAAPGRARQRRAPRPARAIGICASTGGPQALLELLGSLPASFPIPILVVQHIATGFADGLARWLDASVPLPVRLGRAARRVERRGLGRAGRRAPRCSTRGGRLALRPRRRRPPHGPRATCCSRASRRTLGRDAVAVVLTGMGRDGADGHGSRARGGRPHDRAGRSHLGDLRHAARCRRARASTASCR